MYLMTFHLPFVIHFKICRYILFQKKSNDNNRDTHILEQRLKENSKSLHALASFLHCSEECSSESIVGEAMLDLADVMVLGKGHGSRFEPSNESMLDDSSIWERKRSVRKAHGMEEDEFSSEEELLDPI